MEQALGMRSSTRRPWTWVLRLLHARSLVPALLPGPWPSGADMADAVAALVDWLAEEDRGFLPELAAEMHLQIALLQRAGLEQVEGQLAQKLASAHSELVQRLPVPPPEPAGPPPAPARPA
ncbi:hypothetical protein CHLRE_16g658775v5 [Chlamydomonas reinhardtii]|uniref:Uncharacterized protein n=1 Tax=Chlamydomonas reinhardtii TaxID=3055 RepID=A0A2K3CTD5_CHLRE|nr:uncharacterized protein CHLRE_16g658775v5 [Chlamydomonas reinhardtii]PNW71546.1 hypothetical protein CHLRE_16g658775v5 [Chlamydomonas reinhardtii]